MKQTINKEYQLFTLYHKNKFNILFHLVCGFIYMSVLFKLLNKNQNLGILMYMFLLLLTMNNIFSTLIICGGIYLFLNYYFTQKMSILKLLIMFLLFYNLPFLSHYATNESNQDVVNRFYESPLNFPFIINIIYLLPFSFKRLI